MRWRHAAALLMLFLLGCTGAHGSVLKAVPPDQALFTISDLPAGFESGPPSGTAVPSWCGGAPVEHDGVDATATGTWVSVPTAGQRATIEHVVIRFKGTGIDRFLAAVRADQSRCDGGVDLTTADGVHLRGKSQAVDLPLLGDGGTAIEGVGGVDGPGSTEKSGGWVTRIVVQRGNTVSVVVFAVVGLDYDTGMRDRLAHLAAAKLEGRA